jgi:hypothetical protein
VTVWRHDHLLVGKEARQMFQLGTFTSRAF